MLLTLQPGEIESMQFVHCRHMLWESFCVSPTWTSPIRTNPLIVLHGLHVCTEVCAHRTPYTELGHVLIRGILDLHPWYSRSCTKAMA
jgi:hypothetical protein